MENDDFVLDEITLNYIMTYYPEQKAEYIIKIFNILNLINKIPDLDIIFDLESVDDYIVEIITSNDELPPDELMDKVNDYLRSSISEFISVLGITFDMDFSYLTTLQVLEGYYNILTIGEDGVDEAYELINTDAGPKELLLNLLTQYSSLRYIDLLDIITDVDINIINMLREKYKLMIFSKNPAIEEESINRLNALIRLDQRFLQTNFYNYFLTESSIIYPLDMNLNILYKNLEQHSGNISIVPYEIFITIFLSENNSNILQQYEENIHIENVNWIKEDTVKHMVILDGLKDLINKSLGVRV